MINVVIEAFDKKTELLVSEIEINNLQLIDVAKVLGLNSDDIDFLLAGAGGFDISAQQVVEIEGILEEKIYNSSYDFQLGTH